MNRSTDHKGAQDVQEEAILPTPVEAEELDLSATEAADALLSSEEDMEDVPAELNDPDFVGMVETVAKQVYLGSLSEKGQDGDSVRNGINELASAIWLKVAESSHPVENTTDRKFLVRAARAALNEAKRARDRVWGTLEKKASRTDKTLSLRSWDKMTNEAKVALAGRLSTFGPEVDHNALIGHRLVITDEFGPKRLDTDGPGTIGRVVSILPTVVPSRNSGQVYPTDPTTVTKAEAVLSTHTLVNDRKRIPSAIVSHVWPRVEQSDFPSVLEALVNPDTASELGLTVASLRKWAQTVQKSGITEQRKLPLIKDSKGILVKDTRVDSRRPKSGNMGALYTPPVDARMGRVVVPADIQEDLVRLLKSAEVQCIRQMEERALAERLSDMVDYQALVRQEDFSANGHGTGVRSKGNPDWTQFANLYLADKDDDRCIMWSEFPNAAEPGIVDGSAELAAEGKWIAVGNYDNLADADIDAKNGYDHAKRAIKKHAGQAQSNAHASVMLALRGTDNLEWAREVHERYYRPRVVIAGPSLTLWTQGREAWERGEKATAWRLAAEAAECNNNRLLVPIMTASEPQDPKPTLAVAKRTLQTARTNYTKAFNRFVAAESDTLAEATEKLHKASKALDKATEVLYRVS